jgi:hypothetical protein
MLQLSGDIPVADAWSLLPGAIGDAWERLDSPCSGTGGDVYYDAPSVTVSQDDERVEVAEEDSVLVVRIDGDDVELDSSHDEIITVDVEGSDVQLLSG